MIITREEVLMNEEQRKELISRVDVLDKVGNLLLLGNSQFTTTQQVADYYEVGLETIKSIMKRHREELKNNGLKLCKRSDIADVLKDTDLVLKNMKGKTVILSENNEISVTNRGMNLFPKRAILNVGMLLQDSLIADEIKYELGINANWNIRTRREIEFKKSLDIILSKIRDLMIENLNPLPHTRLYSEMKQAIINLTMYKQQYCVCDNKYRIDFYFPLLNIAVEYDEKYHNDNKQMLKDKKREYEIKKYFYINKYYNDITEEESEEWEFESLGELYDYEYDNSNFCDFYTSDLTKFIRIKEETEIEDLFGLSSTLTYHIKEEIDARGMSCNYKDLLC